MKSRNVKFIFIKKMTKVISVCLFCLITFSTMVLAEQVIDKKGKVIDDGDKDNESQHPPAQLL